MKSLHQKLIHLLLMLGCTLNLQAQHRQRPSTPEARVANWLKTMDKDGDKKISSKEATALMKKNFSRIDANKDGFLVQTELTQLANRLSRNRQRPQNQRGNNRRAISTEQLLKTAPKDVVIEPDIAYHKGKSEAWKLDLVMPKSKSSEQCRVTLTPQAKQQVLLRLSCFVCFHCLLCIHTCFILEPTAEMQVHGCPCIRFV